jgi:ABC-type spermidine/putrescine transport system permease subunit II
MRFLQTLFWCLLGFVAALFTYGNWTSIPVKLWSSLIADVNLPFLLLVTFLAGLVPALIWGQTVRWRLRQRLARAEERAAYTPPPAPARASAQPMIAGDA